MTEARRQLNGDPIVSERQLAQFVAATFFASVPQDLEDDEGESVVAHG